MSLSESRVTLRSALWTIAILCLATVAMQFVRPEIGRPPVTAELQAPPAVKQVLRNSCYNCHSNETKLSWFDQVAPAYWIAAHDVKRARSVLNFSEIGKLPAAQQKGLLYEAVNQIQMGAMPVPAYCRLHPESRVTPEALAILRAYLNPATPAPASTPPAQDAAAEQYDQWLHRTGVATPVQATPNGIAFIPGYKNWKPVSSTDRFDNGTLRAILGNDVAIKAIAENRINPWPDGTAFAKVAWKQQTDAQGIVHAGAFIQVEFMIRDSGRYAQTKGWGWARWRGTDLKPYGKDAAFTGECIRCHEPVRQNDYVYTMPFRGQQ